MKSRTIKSAMLAGVLALSMSGCALIAPVATKHPYDPSDGVGADVSEVDVRNLVLIADEPGGLYNVVFTAVNAGDATDLSMTFVGDNGVKHTVDFEVANGNTAFGELDKETTKLLQLGKQAIGSTVNTFISANGESVELHVPVLDGTLDEYKPYVPTAATIKSSDN